MYEYNSTFYEHINIGATRSAETILPHIKKYFNVNSVIDFGCGQGAWLKVWRSLGAMTVHGVDGDYVNQNALLIERDDFTAIDLRMPINTGRRYDLVQSLEVAEHLPEHAADQFIDNLVSHGKIIIFSAAVKGQGGEDHINEQPYEYWRDKFLKRGYFLYDCIRPAIMGNTNVEPWYRYNIFLFISSDIVSALHEDIANYRIKDTDSITDVSPLSYKARKRVSLLLPVSVMTWLASLKKKMAVSARKMKTSQ